jgi:hypothetical protein
VSGAKPRPAPRPKTGARDPLIAAMIGKLPAQGPWPHEDREAWLNLMKAAFDVTYGRNGAPPPVMVSGPAGGGMADAAPVARVSPGDGESIIDFQLAKVATRFYVEPDGTARAPGGAEAALEAVPVGTALLDYRAEAERGRLDTVIWADGTWPAGHVASRSLRLEPASKAA